MKLAKRMERLGTETAFEVLARAKELEAAGRSICHLEIGAPDLDTPDFVVEAACDALHAGYTKYGPAPGDPELREAVAAYAGALRGVEIDPGAVVVVPGAKPILFFTLLALVEEGDEVLVPDPGFPIYASVVALAGGTPVPYRLDEARGFAMDPATLRRARGGIFNTPHNPTGGLIVADDWDRVAALDLEWLISDEVYAEILFGGAHASALAHPALREKTILCDAFSKTWSMTGWRLGYGVLPPTVAEAVTRLQINCTSCAATFSQRAALAALRGPREPVERMVETFKRRRDLFVSGLNDLPGVSCAEPQGAFYAFPNVSGATDDAAALARRLLEEAGVACVAGTAFGAAGRDHIRFSFAAPTETLREALDRMARLLR
ncbi:MAG: pyridoxal phosphate-dependent aminotransferase [Planctomycetota bacterium]